MQFESASKRRRLAQVTALESAKGSDLDGVSNATPTRPAVVDIQPASQTSGFVRAIAPTKPTGRVSQGNGVFTPPGPAKVAPALFLRCACVAIRVFTGFRPSICQGAPFSENSTGGMSHIYGNARGRTPPCCRQVVVRQGVAALPTDWRSATRLQQ